MIQSDEILTIFTASSASFENLYSSHDSKCDYAKRPFRTFDANAKEKDYESGFHYYGSRYYSSELSIWNSTDPMADKYPSLTPYNYCANNPVKLIDPNGEEIGWYINENAEVIGRDKEDDDKIYLVTNKFDKQRIISDDFKDGVSQSDLRGDISEVPSYESRLALKELYEVGDMDKINAGEYGMQIFENIQTKKIGYRLYHTKATIQLDKEGNVSGNLDMGSVSNIIKVGGDFSATRRTIIAHTHNIDIGRDHPPTIGSDNVPQNTIGIVFDYNRGKSKTYIYSSETKFRNDSFIPSNKFFNHFRTPGGKEL